MSHEKQKQFTDYTLQDCACSYCLYFTGEKKDCPLPICACLAEKQQALKRKGVDISE